MPSVTATCGETRAGCNQPHETARTSYAAYLGNSACAECHAAESKKHHNSRHATTMRSVDLRSLGRDFPVAGDIPDTNFVVKPSGAGFVLAVKYQPELQQPLQYALGSGKFALTFINVHDKDSVVELRESYYPTLHAWNYTPGQAHIEGDGLGRLYQGRLARACVTCHTTALPSDSLTPEPRFFGVGCESCHGPGRDHVAAMRSGKAGDLHLARLNSLDATTMNERCGRCHRSAKNVPVGETSTQRFQPYGLMKSRCFLESGNKLSCQTCHDPHENASTDHKTYEQICLSCHASTDSKLRMDTKPKGKPCPVNKQRDCIRCHMPQREVTKDAPISMADHFIRVHRSEPPDTAEDQGFNEID